MGKKSRQRFINEKRRELVNTYDRYLNEYGENHPKVRYMQRKLNPQMGRGKQCLNPI